MVVVVGPAAQKVAGADAAVARFAAVEEPGPGGEVDRVGGVVHGHVDVVVAFVLVGGGALGAVWGEGRVSWWVRWMDGGATYQSPLENSFALRLAERGERGVADTAALRATMVARREVACMVAGVEGDVLGVQVWDGELVVQVSLNELVESVWLLLLSLMFEISERGLCPLHIYTRSRRRRRVHLGR